MVDFADEVLIRFARIWPEKYERVGESELRVMIENQKYQGGQWVDGGFTSGGSANGTKVWVNETTNCCNAAATLFHEVAHTDQPSSMAGSQREYDAYIKTEQWRIKKGLPPQDPTFRKRVPNPQDSKPFIEVPDPDAIKKKVDKTYAYNPPTPISGGPPPPTVQGLAANGTDVQLSDGTTRPPQAGDAYRLPDTGGKVVETIATDQWKCP